MTSVVSSPPSETAVARRPVRGCATGVADRDNVPGPRIPAGACAFGVAAEDAAGPRPEKGDGDREFVAPRWAPANAGTGIGCLAPLSDDEVAASDFIVAAIAAIIASRSSVSFANGSIETAGARAQCFSRVGGSPRYLCDLVLPTQWKCRLFIFRIRTMHVVFVTGQRALSLEEA